MATNGTGFSFSTYLWVAGLVIVATSGWSSVSRGSLPEVSQSPGSSPTTTTPLLSTTPTTTRTSLPSREIPDDWILVDGVRLAADDEIRLMVKTATIEAVTPCGIFESRFAPVDFFTPSRAASCSEPRQERALNQFIVAMEQARQVVMSDDVLTISGPLTTLRFRTPETASDYQPDHSAIEIDVRTLATGPDVLGNRTGLASTQQQLDQLIAESGLNMSEEIDFDLEVVAWFSDSELRCSAAPAAVELVAAEPSILSPKVETSSTCSSDRGSVLVAMSRSDLPDGAFAVQLDQHFPPAGFPGERTIVTSHSNHQINLAPTVLSRSPNNLVRSDDAQRVVIEAADLVYLTHRSKYWVAENRQLPHNVPVAWPRNTVGSVTPKASIRQNPQRLVLQSDGHLERYFPFEGALGSVPNSTLQWPHDRDDNSVTVGRGNWESGRVQAEIVAQLLREIGFDATTGPLFEFSPGLGYRTLAEGDIDLWANAWMPNHETWFEGETQGGERIGDLVTRFDQPMVGGGGLQGMLITKSWADEYGITTLDQINEDQVLWSQLDSDGNGRGEFFGCPGDWTCDDIMASQIAFNGWGHLEQVQSWFSSQSSNGLARYEDMWAEFIGRVRAGEPAVAYTWAPTRYLAEAQPGIDTMWLSVSDQSVLDNYTTINGHGDDWFTQVTADGTTGYKGLPADVCTQGPDGCQTGWLAADIELVANSQWLQVQPEAHALVESIQFDVLELSELHVKREQLVAAGGEPAEVTLAVANEWIAQNRTLVDEWIVAAQ